VLLSDLPTPQVVVDHDRVRRNIDRAQSLADAAGLRLRPHAKTHKLPIVAAWQIERGAVGVCCAKIGEAEVFAAAGVEDIRLPYPVNPSNATRLLALMDRASMSIIVDHLAVARGWSEAMQRAGRSLDVLIKSTSGSIAAGSIRRATPSPSSNRCRRCAACGCAVCSATRDTAIQPARRTSCAPSRSAKRRR